MLKIVPIDVPCTIHFPGLLGMPIDVMVEGNQTLIPTDDATAIARFASLKIIG
jgi:hypothetical protein